MKGKNKLTKSKQTGKSAAQIETGSGDVFADLGFEDSEERLLKAKLATKIAQLIEKKGWTQAQTAERTALDQPKVSGLCAASSLAFQPTACSLYLTGWVIAFEVRISAKERAPENLTRE